jgi:hypothetical protein
LVIRGNYFSRGQAPLSFVNKKCGLGTAFLIIQMIKFYCPRYDFRALLLEA